IAGHSQGVVAAVALASATDFPSFTEFSKRALGILMVTSAMAQIIHPAHALSTDDLADSMEHGGKPSPMVSFRGIQRSSLESIIAEFNDHRKSPQACVYLSLINSYDQFVVSGELSPIVRFVTFARSKCADLSLDQSHLPPSERKPTPSIDYLYSSVLCHCALMAQDEQVDYAYVTDKGWTFDSANLQTVVYAGDDAHDLRSEPDLTWFLMRSLGSLSCNWPHVVSSIDATHIVDLSPGGFSLFARLAHSIAEGSGKAIVSASALTASPKLPFGTKADLYRHNTNQVVFIPSWQHQFGPRIVRTTFDGSLHIETKLHYVTGLPPLLVGTVDPLSVDTDFVAAIGNAGYLAELDVRAMSSDWQFTELVEQTISRLPLERGVFLCCDYADQAHWSVQFPAVLNLRFRNKRVAGVCISGGVPGMQAIGEIVNKLQMFKITYIAFKLTTPAELRQAINIAKAHPTYSFILQWLGRGRADSFSTEDFHQPLLELYSKIRMCPNIILTVGSDFGDSGDTLPYITGDWSVAFGRPPMPVDGAVLGSPLLVCKEAPIDDAIKELVVDMSGVDDEQALSSNSGTFAKTVSITTLDGTPLQVAANRGAVFIHWLQNSILSLPVERQQAALLAEKADIIHRLNTDFMRPWFGKSSDGCAVDLEDMSYAEVVERLLELAFSKEQSRWVHLSLRSLVFDFMRRLEDRFTGHVRGRIVEYEGELDEPYAVMDHTLSNYPAARTTLIASEDIQFFIARCKHLRSVAMPFIPVIDEDFAMFLLRDMTWQLRDLRSVADSDAQR
ncbi:fatty acid synthase alpha subunit Lsd1, partial [Linderina pennispora]